MHNLYDNSLPTKDNLLKQNFNQFRSYLCVNYCDFNDNIQVYILNRDPLEFFSDALYSAIILTFRLYFIPTFFSIFLFFLCLSSIRFGAR